MKKYNLSVTEEQLKMIGKATELLARVSIGQWREIVEYLPLKKDANYSEFHDDLNFIGKLLSKNLMDNIDGWSSSLSICSHKVKEDAKISIDISDTIRHYLSWKDAIEKGHVESFDSPRNWDKMLTVNYDVPLHISKIPLPEIKPE